MAVPPFETASRAEIEERQQFLLRRLLDEVFRANRFYQRKFAAAGVRRHDVATLSDLRRLPFTTKAELLADQESAPPYGANLTYPIENYARFHQTSGTSGRPLRWLDTPADWKRLKQCWRTIFRIGGIGRGRAKPERLFFPFSFGPFLGFWTAFEAADDLGCLRFPAGGMSSLARLRLLIENQATVVLCTPTYALHLAQVAQENGISLEKQGRTHWVHTLIVAGEPGGSIPATRRRIEEAWGARVLDHHGMTEVGPMSIECREAGGGLHILEADYVIEVIDPRTGHEVPPGELGELVVTNLHRLGSPVLRYRTGDLVRTAPHGCACGRTFVRLEGGILGRTDDMLSIRGNNFYPSALEEVIRGFAEVAEYRVTVDATNSLAELRIEVEPATSAPADLGPRLTQAIRDRLLFRAEVTVVAPGALPRFEMKAQRILHKTQGMAS